MSETAGQRVWRLASEKSERFQREHGGRAWLDHDRAPRVTGDDVPVPETDEVPWDVEAGGTL